MTTLAYLIFALAGLVAVIALQRSAAALAAWIRATLSAGWDEHRDSIAH